MAYTIDEQIEAVQQEVTITRFNHQKARPKIKDQSELDHLKKLEAAVQTLEKVKEQNHCD